MAPGAPAHFLRGGSHESSALGQLQHSLLPGHFGEESQHGNDAGTGELENSLQLHAEPTRHREDHGAKVLAKHKGSGF